MNLVIFLACSLGVPPMSTSVDTQKLTCAGGWEEGRMIRFRCDDEERRPRNVHC